MWKRCRFICHLHVLSKMKSLVDVSQTRVTKLKKHKLYMQIWQRHFQVTSFTCNQLIYCYDKQFCVVYFSFRGICDDITFLLEVDLSSLNLCALHCELCNTEQLLWSLGLFAYKVGSLPECNDELSQYGPENFNSWMAEKLKEGQETAVEKHNIKSASFSSKYNVHPTLKGNHTKDVVCM